MYHKQGEITGTPCFEFETFKLVVLVPVDWLYTPQSFLMGSRPTLNLVRILQHGYQLSRSAIYTVLYTPVALARVVGRRPGVLRAQLPASRARRTRELVVVVGVG